MKTLTLIQYRHPSAGFSIPLPPNWELSEDVQPNVRLVVVEPANEPGFRANFVVTVESVSQDSGLEAWQASAEGYLPNNLAQYTLLDEELVTNGPYPTIRRLAHHEADGDYSVTMEQWALVEGGLGYTITFSVGTLAYDAYADLAAEAAAGFVPGDPKFVEGS